MKQFSYIRCDITLSFLWILFQRAVSTLTFCASFAAFSRKVQ